MGDLEPGPRWGDLLGCGEREEWGDRWGENPSMLDSQGITCMSRSSLYHAVSLSLYHTVMYQTVKKR